MLNQLISGFNEHDCIINQYDVNELEIYPCKGCLRCNVTGRCSITNDGWAELAEKIINADILVFATPIFFHHLPAPLKKILDRFRSFIHVQITDTGLIHTPRGIWKKDFVLLLSMGSPDANEANAVVELFYFMNKILGNCNSLHTISATRLAVIRQIEKSEKELGELYKKMKISSDLVPIDYINNQKILNSCFCLGERLTREKT